MQHLLDRGNEDWKLQHTLLAVGSTYPKKCVHVMRRVCITALENPQSLLSLFKFDLTIDFFMDRTNDLRRSPDALLLSKHKLKDILKGSVKSFLDAVAKVGVC